jgi:hypothetical protein
MADKIPKTNPELFNKLIYEHDLYTGPDGTGELVGEVNDLVINFETGFKRVVDVIDNIASLRPWTPPVITTINDDLGHLGLLNSNADNFLFLDTTVTPHRVSIPSSVTFAGSQKKYAKLFFGSDLTEANGVVISAHYENGSYISENIPLERVIVSDYTNDALKTMKESYINTRLPDNELVTLVVYSETGVPTDIREFRVYNTNYVKSLSVRESYITSIELNSSLFSDNDDTLLEIPMNTSLSELDITATIRYRNEDSRTVAIDGNKMRIDGIDNYISNTDGKQANINLVYSLDDGEYTLNANGVKTRYINQKYKLVTRATEGNYTVKLFVVPVWVDDVTGYVLEYYLYDLTRGDYYYATPFVEMGSTSQPFKGKLYGTEQWLTVTVDVSKANRNSKPYRHVQRFAVSLLTNGLADSTPWLIRYEDDGKLEYGHNLEATLTYQAVNDWRLDISNNLSNTTDFLNNTFYASKPLINTEIEKITPTPTHFIVNIGGRETEHVLSEWNNVINSTVGGEEGKPLILHWLRKLGGQVLHLGLTPLIIRHEIRSLANSDSNQSQAEQETLTNEFLTIPDGLEIVDYFDKNTAFKFNEDGTFEILWDSLIDNNGDAVPGTGFIGDWIDGERDLSNRYTISVAFIERWEAGDGINQIELFLNGVEYTSGTRVDLTGDTVFSLRSDFAPSDSSASISIAIANKDVPATNVIDTITLTKD